MVDVSNETAHSQPAATENMCEVTFFLLSALMDPRLKPSPYLVCSPA